MKYEVGDRVRIKSLDWYNQMLSIPSKIVGKDNFVAIECGAHIFTKKMSKFCGRVMTIQTIGLDFYLMEEDNLGYEFTDEMIEGLVEEETEKKVSDESWRYKNIFDHSQYPQSFELPEGYQFVDENGNVINATKIVLEKKKKEYPKTKGECYSVLASSKVAVDRAVLLGKFETLLACRDAYWKIAGEEMGLGKPWEPDWENKEEEKYTIEYFAGMVFKDHSSSCGRPFAFPTPKMRDAFYENFKSLIESCKEFL